MHALWEKLPRPFFVLAPMADVTDPAYRKLIAEYGAPHVTWTEFVSADGLFHTRQKMKDEENPLVRDLLYTEAERPILAQVFSSNPDMIRYAGKLAAELGFDGIDINMGCPDRSIEKQGAGAAMMKNPLLVPEIVRAAREGVAQGGKPDMSVSIKTRIGYNKEEIDTWIPAVLKANPDALTVHLRTRKEMSKVAAYWEHMPRIIELRNAIAPHIPILGNGDVMSLEDARQKVAESGADGVMLGRAIFGTPWLFTGRTDVSVKEKLEALIRLAEYFEEMRPQKSFHLLKKHVKAFVTGFDNAAELRGYLMDSESAEDMKRVLQEHKALVP